MSTIALQASLLRGAPVPPGTGPGPPPIPWTSQMVQASPIYMPDFARYIGRDTHTLEFWISSFGVDGNCYYTTLSGYARYSCHFPYGDTIYFDCANPAQGRLTTYYPRATFQNTLHHTALQLNYATGEQRIILDGVVVATQIVPPADIENVRYSPGNTTDHFIIPAQQALMGEVRYWTTYRTIEQIQQFKNQSFSSGAPGLLGCWRCDERGPAGTLVQDRSGNDFHGLIY